MEPRIKENYKDYLKNPSSSLNDFPSVWLMLIAVRDSIGASTLANYIFENQDSISSIIIESALSVIPSFYLLPKCSSLRKKLSAESRFKLYCLYKHIEPVAEEIEEFLRQDEDGNALYSKYKLKLWENVKLEENSKLKFRLYPAAQIEEREIIILEILDQKSNIEEIINFLIDNKKYIRPKTFQDLLVTKLAKVRDLANLNQFLDKLDIETQLRIITSSTDINPHTKRLVKIFQASEIDSVAEKVINDFWNMHFKMSLDLELREYAPDNIKIKAMIKNDFRTLPPNEKKLLLKDLSNKLQPEDWNYVIELLLLDGAKNGLLLDLILDAPLEIRLSKFVGFLELNYIKSIVVKTIDEAKLLLSECLTSSIFWDKIKIDTPEHWILDIAPSNFKRKYLTGYYKPLLDKLYSTYLMHSNIIRCLNVNEVYSNLDDRDHKLAEIWTDITRGHSYNKSLACMLSARAAEKFIANLYTQLGYEVTDISIKQLDKGQLDWMTHDLHVKNYGLIDVKNARTPVNGNKFYVEHFVKRFNKTNYGKDVIIAGVLSPFMENEEIHSCRQSVTQNRVLIYLGETTINDILELSNKMTNEFITINPPIINAVPPWYFKYGEAFLKNKNIDFHEISSSTKWPKDSYWEYILNDGDNLIPDFLMFRVGLPSPIISSLAHWEKEFLEYTTQKSNLKFSVPVVFFVVLTHFLGQIRCNSTGYHPSGYLKYLFPTRPQHKLDPYYPLGLPDPLQLIYSLIQTITILWDNKSDSNLDKFKFFRLQGLGILLGNENKDEPLKTILAYCGGWVIENDPDGFPILDKYGNPKKIGRCGNFPLILGKNKNCPRCKKLICNKCGFCSQPCFDKRIADSIIEGRNFNKEALEPPNYLNDGPPIAFYEDFLNDFYYKDHS